MLDRSPALTTSAAPMDTPVQTRTLGWRVQAWAADTACAVGLCTDVADALTGGGSNNHGSRKRSDRHQLEDAAAQSQIDARNLLNAKRNAPALAAENAEEVFDTSGPRVVLGLYL